METTVGIFRSLADTERALAQLRSLGIGFDKISVLLPGTTSTEAEAIVPTSDTESPGMGEALGGVVGGAIGAGVGATLGTAVASLLVPGVGPVLAAGILGAALLGTGGAIAGVQAGDLLEHALAHGLPHDELFVYEDALRKGRTVLIVYSEDSETKERVQDALLRAGAESIDAAREDWWLGLRDAEAEQYERAGRSFKQDETNYRRGFETALYPKMRGRSFAEASETLAPEICNNAAFRAGYERGQAHQKNLEERRQTQASRSASRGRAGH